MMPVTLKVRSSTMMLLETAGGSAIAMLKEILDRGPGRARVRSHGSIVLARQLRSLIGVFVLVLFPQKQDEKEVNCGIH
jgi:hypothetical protein